MARAEPDGRNSVPSRHMRCRMTESFLATATFAFLIPERRARSRPQARSAEGCLMRVRITFAASYMAKRKEAQIPDAILDQRLSGSAARTAFDRGGLLDQLKKALSERARNAEMEHHQAGEGGAANSRNGHGRNSVVTDSGRIALEVPRDRQGRFDPLLIAKYQRRFSGFDDKIILMYARGMSTREIAGRLLDLYGIEVSADLISTVTDAVLDEIATWQARPLEPVYPLVLFDALRVKIRDEGLVDCPIQRIP